ncbi:MAG: glutathione peroxidase [Gammaproteobacteria bacterium]|jgi:glutathione peroxidase|nr:glutathione peroxidase [Gammaproteobacteria bacterium]
MTKKFMICITLIGGLAALANVQAADGSETLCPATLDFTKRPLASDQAVNLCKEYLGKVVLVVNTASKCGYTPQYEGLEALYRKYKDRGLVVLGFPSNDFGGQEPGSEKQIQNFCRLTYGVEFPMFEKTRAAKANADPIYRTLGDMAGEYPQWNFHKYVLDRQGRLIASYNSRIEPQSKTVIETIERLL